MVTNSATKLGTSYGPEVLVQLRGGRRRAQLEDRLRELVRDGTLPAHARLPSSRALASDLEVSRRLVVDAYAQLLAEGYLVARQGAGTYVAGPQASPTASPRSRPPGRCASTSSQVPPTWAPSRGRCGCARCAKCCARRRRAHSPTRTGAARTS